MRISELAADAGISVATIKYYIREGLLPPGKSTGARSADYDHTHLKRLKLVTALTELAGLPLSQAKIILELITTPSHDLFEALGTAVAALPPYVEPASDYPRAREVLEQIDQPYEGNFPAVAQLDQALRAAAEAGIPADEKRIDVYAQAVRLLAEYDLSQLPNSQDPSEAIEYAVLGTALYEPVIIALWRLTHKHLAQREFGGPSSAAADSPLASITDHDPKAEES